MNGIHREKLTRRFLMSLNDGNYIRSNAGPLPNRSWYEGCVVPMANRQEQWEQIKAAGADQVLCWVYQSKADADVAFEQMTQGIQ